MIRVLFICLGNICRSPMAEAVFMHKVRLAELEGAIVADSAGTGHWHLGEPPHLGTRQILTSNGIEYTHRARLFDKSDLDKFDYVIAMDDTNLRDIQKLGIGPAAISLFLTVAPEMGVREVPDPYYNGQFQQVYDLVDIAADKLLQSMRQSHNI